MTFILFLLLFVGVCGWLDARARSDGRTGKEVG